MNILALDLGTAMGWAFGSPGVTNGSGTISFKNDRYSGGGMRYLRFQRWLNELYNLGSVETVYFEEVRRHLGVDAAHVYGGFMATLTAWCEAHAISYQGVPVGTIKKHITGKGNASKVEVINAVKALGHNPKDDNEADAIALLDYVNSQKYCSNLSL